MAATASSPARLLRRPMLPYYRAWREDIAQDEVDKDVKLRCPTLALWGAEFEAANP
jgi:hypothetical protein